MSNFEASKFTYLTDGDPAVADRNARAGRERAPGKRVATDHLPPHRPEWKNLVEDGTACDVDSTKPGCHYTPEQRIRAVSYVLAPAVASAMDNYRDAILQTWTLFRIQPGANGWGMIAELLFGAASSAVMGPLVGAITRGGGKLAAQLAEDGFDKAAVFAARAGAVVHDHTDKVKAVVLQASKGTRTSIKNALHGPMGDHTNAKFTELLAEQIKPLTDAIILRVGTLNDDELDTMIEMYRDARRHSIAAYRAAIEALVARYNDNFMPQVGVDSGVFEHGDVRWIVDQGGTRRRMALFRSAGLRHHPQDGVSPSEMEFERWIDPDFMELAADIYKQRRGREPDTYSLDDFSTVRGHSWLEVMLVDAIHDIGGNSRVNLTKESL